MKISKILHKWNGKALCFSICMSRKITAEQLFLGLAMTTPDWEWVDGCMASTSIVPGEWNKVIFKLTDKMKFCGNGDIMRFYLCFWQDEEGIKVPLRKSDPFYIDSIGVDPNH